MTVYISIYLFVYVVLLGLELRALNILGKGFTPSAL